MTNNKRQSSRTIKLNSVTSTNGKRSFNASSPRKMLNIRQRNYDILQDWMGVLRNPEKVTIEDFSRVLKDDTVSAAVEFLTLAISNMIQEYSHEDEEINDFVNQCFEQMRGSLKKHIREMIHCAKWSGFSVTEFSIRDGARRSRVAPGGDKGDDKGESDGTKGVSPSRS